MQSPSRVSRRIAAAVAALLLAAPVAAQNGIDAHALRQYGGRYATDCANPAAPQLRVAADALTIEQNGQRMTGRGPVSAYSYFGNATPPKNFQVALIGTVRGGPQLLFMVYADATGAYIQLDGDAKVSAALGKALLAPKYRRCAGALAAAGAAAPVPSKPLPLPTAPTAAGPRGLPQLAALTADPAFKRAYQRSIGPKASERWLARLDGPAPPTREQAFDGTPYVVVAVCKAHDCYDHNAVFLYDSAQPRVLGLIQQKGVKTLVGAPGPGLGAQIERLWQSEWRQ